MVSLSMLYLFLTLKTAFENVLRHLRTVDYIQQ
jgi:hypothetical protein